MPGFQFSAFSAIKIRTKLTLAFFTMAVLVGVSGAFGLFYVKEIGRTMSIFTDVTSPLLSETLHLVDNAQRTRAASRTALIASGKERTSELELAKLDEEARQGIARLQVLAQQAGQSK